jgi:hypothetical protein
MSFSCAQKKVLLLLHQLDRKQNIELVGNLVSVERIGEVYSSLVKDSGFEDRLNNIQDQGVLGHLLEERVERYLDSHVIRVSLPSWIRADVEGYAEATNVLDFGLGNVPADEDAETTNALDSGLQNILADEGKERYSNQSVGFVDLELSTTKIGEMLIALYCSILLHITLNIHSSRPTCTVKKLRCLSPPRENYTDRAIAACRN